MQISNDELEEILFIYLTVFYNFLHTHTQKKAFDFVFVFKSKLKMK